MFNAWALSFLHPPFHSLMPFNDFVVIITSHYYFNNSEEAVQFNKTAIALGPFFLSVCYFCAREPRRRDISCALL